MRPRLGALRRAGPLAALRMGTHRAGSGKFWDKARTHLGGRRLASLSRREAAAQAGKEVWVDALLQ